MSGLAIVGPNESSPEPIELSTIPAECSSSIA